MKKNFILIHLFIFHANLKCMETADSQYTPYKRITEYNRQFNPKTRQTKFFSNNIDVLDIREKEKFTQKTFLELIQEHEEECCPYIIARVEVRHEPDQFTNQLGLKYLYYDAYSLLKYLYETPKKSETFLDSCCHRYNQIFVGIKNDITTGQTILGLIKFYKINNTQEKNFIYIGSDYDLYDAKADWIYEYLKDYFIHEINRYKVLKLSLIAKAEHYWKSKKFEQEYALKIFQKIIQNNLPDKLRAQYYFSSHEYYHSEDQEIKNKALSTLQDVSTKFDEDPQVAQQASDLLDNVFRAYVDDRITNNH